jgi:hypothetical protein
MAQTRGSPRLNASRARRRASPSSLSVLALRLRRDVAIDDRRRIDHVAFDAFGLQQAVQPEAVKPGLLDADDLEGLSGAGLGLVRQFREAQQQGGNVACWHGMLGHLLAGTRRQGRDEPDFLAQFQRHENRGKIGVDGGRRLWLG